MRIQSGIAWVPSYPKGCIRDLEVFLSSCDIAKAIQACKPKNVHTQGTT